MKQLWMWFVFIGITMTVEFLAPQPALSIEEIKPAPTPSTPTVANEGDREKEAEEVKRLQEFFLRNQSVFIRGGEVIVEFNNFYSTDRRQDFLLIGPGQLALADTARRIFESSLLARVGIASGLELDVRVPYVHTDQTITIGGGSITNSSTGVGDASVSLRYQMWYEKGLRPSIIIDVNGKSRTADSVLLGTGNYSVGGGVTLLKSIDLVYFFARIGYTDTLAAPGRDLGNSYEYSMGMGFSLNDRVAFNMQYVGAQIGQVKINNLEIDNSSLEIGGLNFSATILITKKLFIEPVIGLGLMRDASTPSLDLEYRTDSRQQGHIRSSYHETKERAIQWSVVVRPSSCPSVIRLRRFLGHSQPAARAGSLHGHQSYIERT